MEGKLILACAVASPAWARFGPLLAVLLLSAPAVAQEGWNDTPPEFPALWINSTPLSVEDFEGKAAILYFFEEGCPKCKRRWPELMTLAAQYADKPVAFIAVNSGTPAPLVLQYARSVGLAWPVIVDLDRSFEKACNVGEISLKNIYQLSYITGEGKIQRGNAGKIEDSVERALKAASWHVDPADIPPELFAVWRLVEFGQYAAAAPVLTKAANSRKPEVKAAAEKLAQVVDGKATEALTAAQDEKSKVRAHQKYAAIAERFDGYPAGTQAAEAGRRLARDPELRQELKAIQLVERQRPLLDSAKASVRGRAQAALKQLIDQQPDSEAARLARALLEAQPVFAAP